MPTLSRIPDLYLATPQSASLENALARRFVLHRDSPPPGTRAIVGGGMMQLVSRDMDRFPALEIVAVHGVGHDGIDLDAARTRSIRVTTTPEVLTDDVADLAIGLWLAVERAIVANDQAARNGQWRVPLSRRATGRTIGIFGLGQIGQAIARRAVPFASRIIYTSRSPKAVEWAWTPDILTLAEQSDVLILAAPGGVTTDGIVDRRVLNALGAGGVLINIARGSLVDEPALMAALKGGTIAGAGLDVFTNEPHVAEALKTMPQVVLSPHQGSATREARQAMEELVIANLDAHFAGKPLPSPIA